jgi:hypothetical protein
MKEPTTLADCFLYVSAGIFLFSWLFYFAKKCLDYMFEKKK